VITRTSNFKLLPRSETGPGDHLTKSRPISPPNTEARAAATVRSVYFEINGDLQQGGRKLLEMITDALIPTNAAKADETE
jgi:hypothetical protein